MHCDYCYGGADAYTLHLHFTRAPSLISEAPLVIFILEPDLFLVGDVFAL